MGFKLCITLAPVPSKLVSALVFSPGRSSGVDTGPFPTAPAIFQLLIQPKQHPQSPPQERSQHRISILSSHFIHSNPRSSKNRTPTQQPASSHSPHETNYCHHGALIGSGCGGGTHLSWLQQAAVWKRNRMILRREGMAIKVWGGTLCAGWWLWDGYVTWGLVHECRGCACLRIAMASWWCHVPSGVLSRSPLLLPPLYPSVARTRPSASVCGRLTSVCSFKLLCALKPASGKYLSVSGLICGFASVWSCGKTQSVTSTCFP